MTGSLTPSPMSVMPSAAPRKSLRGSRMRVSCWSCGPGHGGGAGGCGSVVLGAAGDVARVVGAGVVGPFPGAGGPVAADREAGDLVDEVVAGGELAAAQQSPGQHPETPAAMSSHEACLGVQVTVIRGWAA